MRMLTNNVQTVRRSEVYFCLDHYVMKLKYVLCHLCQYTRRSQWKEVQWHHFSIIILYIAHNYVNTNGLHGGHGGSRFLHNMLSLGFFLVLLSRDLLIKTMHLSIIPDLASWSPCPSWPSEPRPQLHTSVSRDGSPSMTTSSPAAWVWPPGDGLQAQGRCRRGDPERKPQNLKEASSYQCCFWLSPPVVVTCWEHCRYAWFTPLHLRRATTGRRKTNMCPTKTRATVISSVHLLHGQTHLLHKQVWCAHTLIKTFKALCPWNNHERPVRGSSCEWMTTTGKKSKHKSWCMAALTL